MLFPTYNHQKEYLPLLILNRTGTFWGSLSNSFDLLESSVMRVFEKAEFNSVIKIEVVKFLAGLGAVFALNLGITREQWLVWAW